jgi:AcrR family transcriptional regulator
MNERVKRGRPRSEAAKQAILRAARELLEEGGPGAVTMEGVASRAGVGKPTVYRWWPDRHAVAMAALMAGDTQGGPDVRRRTVRTELRQKLALIAQRFSTHTGRHVTSLIAAADSESELSKAFRNHFVLAQRTQGKDLLDRGVQTGELRPDLDIEVALDMLYGPLFFRLLMGHAKLDGAFIDRLLDQALRGMSAKKKPKRQS